MRNAIEGIIREIGCEELTAQGLRLIAHGKGEKLWTQCMGLKVDVRQWKAIDKFRLPSGA